MEHQLFNSREAAPPAELPLTRSSSYHPSIPTGKNERRSWLHRKQASSSGSHLIILLIFISCCVSLSSASSFFIDEQMVETRDVETLESTFARLARSGTILVDRSPPPAPAADWSGNVVPEAVNDLRRRQVSSASTATTVKTASSSSGTSTVASSSTIASSSSATTSIPVAISTSTSDLPAPFDLGFSGNISTNCQTFMNTMLTNSTFKTCLPLSLLLQNSNSFFQAQKSLVRITQTLDYSCAANITTCSNLMSTFASNITAASACADDLSSQNPIIQQARLGLLAYKPLYSASCLRNPSTSAYCFADAITNSNNSADAYVYYLPLNNSLVGGSQPTCNSCLKNTMSVFEAATSDRSSALASVYSSAASQVNVNCGPGYVNSSLAAAVVSSAPGIAGPNHIGIFTLVLLVASWLL